MNRTTLLAIAGTATLSSAPSARLHTEGNHANTWTPGQTIKVCVCPTPGDVDISGPLQGAINIWNNSKAGFNGGVLFEWHLTLLDCSEDPPPECDLVIDWDPDPNWGSVQAGGPPVNMDSTVGGGLNDRGVQRVLMHELGHVKGLGHSGLSDIMKWNFRGQGGNSPTAGDLNGADAFEAPNADDIALNKKLHGTEAPKAKADASGSAAPEAEDLWRYSYGVQGLQEPGLIDPITRFTLELPPQLDPAKDLAVDLMPPGWVAAWIAPEPELLTGVPLDVEEQLQPAVLTFFTEDPELGIFPGEFQLFEVLSPWAPVGRRSYTNTPNADTDIFDLPVPAGFGAAVQLLRVGEFQPNPLVFLPGTTGPVIGQVWDPYVDHTSFVPGALADFMLISLTPIDAPIGPAGSLLCLPPFLVTLFDFTPADPFPVPIPNDPFFVGLGLCSQVGSSPDGSSFQLTNAIDFVIGLF